MTARLYVLLARTSARAVVFRRGPSKSVLMVAWDTGRDTFEEGQWLRGRLYERRCDLSPDGRLLVYFAAKYKQWLGRIGEPGAFPTWTAVCRPPYFTALTLWPGDDAYNGGGLFEDDRTLLLNHGAWVPEATAEPGPLAVRPLGGPRGEDGTVLHRRMLRDGWSLANAGRCTHQPEADPHFLYDPPEEYVRPQPLVKRRALVLRRQVLGLGRVNGPWYDEKFIVDDPTQTTFVLEDAEWADWDRNGNLLFARQGALVRVRSAALAKGPPYEETPLADLRDRTFVNVAPPPRYGW